MRGLLAALSIATCLCLLTAPPQSRAQSGTGLSCPVGLSPPWAVYGGSCYQFVSTSKTWEKARQHCHQQGAAVGKLVSIPDSATQNWIVARLSATMWMSSSSSVWLGLHDRDRELRFFWDEYDGRDRPANYFNWYLREPSFSRSQNCVYMRRQNGWKWSDAECDSSQYRAYSFICQYRLTNVTTTTSSATAKVTTALVKSIAASATATPRTSTTLSTRRPLSALTGREPGRPSFTTLAPNNQTVAAAFVTRRNPPPAAASAEAETSRSASAALPATAADSASVGSRLISTLTGATAAPDTLTSSRRAAASTANDDAGGFSGRPPSTAEGLETVAGKTSLSPSGVTKSSNELASPAAGNTSQEAPPGASTEATSEARRISAVPDVAAADLPYSVTSHSIYTGILISYGLTTAADNISIYPVTSQSSTPEMTTTAAAAAATAASKTSTVLTTEIIEYGTQAGPRSNEMVTGSRSAALEAANTAAPSLGLPMTTLPDMLLSNVSVTFVSHTSAAMHSGPHETRPADLRLYVGVGVGVALPLLLLVVILAAVALFKRKKKLPCRSRQKHLVLQISIENPMYSAFDPNEREALSMHSDGQTEAEFEKFNRDKELNAPLLKHAVLT